MVAIFELIFRLLFSLLDVQRALYACRIAEECIQSTSAVDFEGGPICLTRERLLIVSQLLSASPQPHPSLYTGLRSDDHPSFSVDLCKFCVSVATLKEIAELLDGDNLQRRWSGVCLQRTIGDCLVGIISGVSSGRDRTLRSSQPPTCAAREKSSSVGPHFEPPRLLLMETLHGTKGVGFDAMQISVIREEVK